MSAQYWFRQRKGRQGRFNNMFSYILLCQRAQLIRRSCPPKKKRRRNRNNERDRNDTKRHIGHPQAIAVLSKADKWRRHQETKAARFDSVSLLIGPLFQEEGVCTTT